MRLQKFVLSILLLVIAACANAAAQAPQKTTERFRRESREAMRLKEQIFAKQT
jgi:hypothetical protein